MSSPPTPPPNPPPKPSKMALPRHQMKLSSHTTSRNSRIGIPFLTSLSTLKLNHLRDNFELTTWLLLGGAFQALISLAPLPSRLNSALTLLPPMLLLWKALHTYLMIWGFVPNPRMGRSKGVKAVMGGNGIEEGREDGCVVMIASQCTHPLAHLYPANHFSTHTTSMIAALSASPTSGFLGSTSWLNADQHTSGNMVMTLLYFRSREDVVRFSRGRAHGRGVEWSRSLEGKKGRIGGGGEYVGMYQENFMRGGEW